MPPDTLSESLKDAISLSQAAALFPKRPHVSTIWRWAIKGCRGIKLATWMAGGKRVTTPAALESFLQRLNDDPDAPDDTDAETIRRSREAGDALKALGC